MKSFDCKACKVSADRSIFLIKLFKKLSLRGKERTEKATVVSKRLASARFPTPGSTWDHWVTFSLPDGTQAEIVVPEVQFHGLTEDQTGTLAWEGENFRTFETE
jgi:hypothetical protein